MEKDFNRISAWLRPKLKALNMSVEELALHCNIGRNTMYGYMSDKWRPSKEAMKRICDFIGVPLSEGLKQYTPNKMGPRKRKPGDSD
jgi:transcriptional regulator with XRE-family HTH domain